MKKRVISFLLIMALMGSILPGNGGSFQTVKQAEAAEADSTDAYDYENGPNPIRSVVYDGKSHGFYTGTLIQSYLDQGYYVYAGSVQNLAKTSEKTSNYFKVSSAFPFTESGSGYQTADGKTAYRITSPDDIKSTELSVGTYQIPILVVKEDACSFSSYESNMVNLFELTLFIADSSEVTVYGTDYTGTYDGKQHTIGMSVPSGTTILYGTEKGTYNLQTAPSYKNAGTYTVYWKWTKKTTKGYTIVKTGSNKVTISKGNMSISSNGYTGIYDQKAHGITVNVLDPAAGAVIKYGRTQENCTLASMPVYGNAGIYTVYFQVTDANYNTYSGQETVRIDKKNLSECVMEPAGSLTYNGNQRVPKVVVKDGTKVLTEGNDYTVSAENNTDVTEKAAVTITGTGNYSGTVTQNFTIDPLKLTKENISVSTAEYQGKEVYPVVSCNGMVLERGKDYTIRCTDNVEAGTAAAEISGMGNYTGTVTAEFEIQRADMENCPDQVVFTQDAYAYEEKGVKPELLVYGVDHVLLEKDRDYVISYSNNRAVGTGSAVIVFKGNYSGTIRKTFKIVSRQITEAEFKEDCVYGVNTEPKPAGYTEGTDYTISYSNNHAAGTGSAVIVFQGNYSGTVEKDFTIAPQPLSDENVSLSADTYIFDGTYHTPAVTAYAKVNGKDVQLMQGETKDYVAEYANNCHAGRAAVRLTGRGNYTGTVYVTFDITPQEMTEENITFPGATDITYGNRLGTSALTRTFNEYGTFAWADPQLMPAVENSGYDVVFVPDNTRDYDWKLLKGYQEEERQVVRRIPLTVNRAEGRVPTFNVEALAEGEELMDSKIYSYEEKLGTFAWDNPKEATTTKQKSYNIRFFPTDTENYDWSDVKGWDPESGYCLFKTAVVVIANPTASEITAGSRLGESELSSDQEGASYEWVNPDVIVTSSDENYVATYMLEGESIRRHVKVSVAAVSADETPAPSTADPDDAATVPDETQKTEIPDAKKTPSAATDAAEPSIRPTAPAETVKPDSVLPEEPSAPAETKKPDDVQIPSGAEASEEPSVAAQNVPQKTEDTGSTQTPSGTENGGSTAEPAATAAAEKAGTQTAKKTSSKEKYKLNKSRAAMKKGKKMQLKLSAGNGKKVSKVSWTSSDKRVVSVSKKGMLLAKKAGTATITAKKGKERYCCKVSVKAGNRKKASKTSKVAKKQKKKNTKGKRLYQKTKIFQERTPKLCKASRSDGKTVLIMRSVAKAAGYDVYVNKKKVSMLCALTINYNGSAALYKAFPAQGETLRVRAYCYEKGKKIYTKWSSIGVKNLVS